LALARVGSMECGTQTLKFDTTPTVFPAFPHRMPMKSTTYADSPVK